MLNLLIVEKRINANGTHHWLAQTEEGVVPDRFCSMLDSNEEDRLILIEPIRNDFPDEAEAWINNRTLYHRLEKVTVWTSPELAGHLPCNVIWCAMLRPAPIASTDAGTPEE